MNNPPIPISELAARRAWLAPDLVCPTCSWHYRAAVGHGDLWLTCQNKKCDRTRWRAISIYPGMIGATLMALFGFELGILVLLAVAPTCRDLTEEEQFGCELNKGTVILWLQWQITKLEAARDAGHVGKGRRVLKTLGAS